MKKFLKIVFSVIFISLVSLYAGVVFLLPYAVNNKVTIDKLQSLIYDKSKVKANITGLNLKVSSKLVFDLSVDGIDTKINNSDLFNLKNLSLSYQLLQNNLTLISAEKIYIDGDNLKQLIPQKSSKPKGKFELKKKLEIHIHNLTYKSDAFSVYAQNIDTIGDLLKLKVSVRTPYVKETIKLGDSGSIQIEENKLKANLFEIALGNSHLYLDGIIVDKNKSSDLNIKGEKLPVSEIMPIVLYLQKSQDPSRKFIENFKNFNGTADVDLKFNKNGLFGKCIGNNLSANAVWFDIPLYFKEAVFNFNGQKVDSVAQGILGKEKVIHTLKITDLFNSQKKLVIGTMKTTLTKKFDYVPNLTVLNSVNVGLVYKIKNKKPDVYYNIDIPVKSDLVYNSFYLGLRDYPRKIYGNTFKDGDDLYIRKYKYFYSDTDKENIILLGDGLFIKNIDKTNPDKFIPQYMTIRTNGYAPVSVIGSFGEKVNGGEFKGDIKYDFNINQLVGTFDIINAKHKAFHIEKAHVVSQNGVFNITSNGFFKGEKYLAELNAKNNIFGETLIYNMKLFLDKLIIETTSDTQPKKRINPEEITQKVKDADITVNNLEILINEIKREKFVLENAKLLGSLKNNIFNFNMDKLNFADGDISAKGIYNFANNTSKISFEAKNINSNKVAEMTLNLQNQIEGTANAKADLYARDMFRFLDVHSEFEVKEGFLPKLGDSEFAIKNSKYKLSQITNYDLTKRDEMQFDIKGAFDVHNTKLTNVNVTSSSPDSAMYLEGNYEMEKQYADLHLFWKYSKESPKGIRIFHIPLSWILKAVFRPEHSKEMYKQQFAKVPVINVDEKRTNYYRVYLNGDINNNKVNFILKEVR